MMLHLILGSAALMAGMFVGGFLLAVVGIRRGDSGKRLYGTPASLTETFSRRMLTGSRDCADSDEAEGGR
jgi:hypothetical protein